MYGDKYPDFTIQITSILILPGSNGTGGGGLSTGQIVGVTAGGVSVPVLVIVLLVLAAFR